MDILKEKQLTIRATKRPVEYNYTNADIHHEDTTPTEGYQFEYPVNWTADQSTNKVIGIRRINYKPTSINLACQLIIDPDNDKVTVPLVYVFTDQNTFEECINKITVDVNAELLNKNRSERLVIEYNKDLGTSDIRVENNITPVDFAINFPYGNDSLYDPTNPEHKKDLTFTHFKRQFLMLFNQTISDDRIDAVHNLYNKQLQLHTENVWNRDTFYCHASFSDSPKQIIGINHDFWPTPSVFYAPSDNSNDFNVYFTTDTVHRILPRNGVMLIQMSYIYNYTNSMLSYV